MKRGFTLAEVLITLGIIGIVAAMTMPALIQKQIEKDVVVSLKKNYSVLNQSFLVAYNNFGETDNWFEANTTSYDILKKLTTNLDVIELKNNGPENKYKMINGNNIPLTDYAEAKLKDGSIIYLQNSSPNCTGNKTWEGTGNKHLKNICSSIYVDVNGYKGPNKLAIDMFGFYLTKYSVYPSGTDDNFVRFDTYCSNKMYGISYGCTAWVLTYENLDYLHCDDLSTNGKHKCK